MDIWRYQVEILAAVVVTVSGTLVALIWDYLINHNVVGREEAREDRRAR